RPEFQFDSTISTSLGKRPGLAILRFRLRTEVLTLEKDASRNEALAIPEQTAAGKETSNPLMADIYLVITSVLVKNRGVNTPRCDEDSLELKKLMVFFVQVVLRKMELELLLVILAKPAERKGFAKIINFLNERSVRYELTASPTIRTSCIKQFWSTTKVKTVNDEVRVQALIDGKRVTIKEYSIHRTLKLYDKEGISCLANDDIFTSLANMGYEKMSDKLTIYKAFFSPQWKFLIHTILQCLVLKPPPGMNLVKLKMMYPFLLNHPLLNPQKEKSKKQQPIAPKVPSPKPSLEHPLPSPSNEPIPTAKANLKFQELMDLCVRLSSKEENKILKETSFKSAKSDTAASVKDKEESFNQGRMIADMDEDVEPAEVEEVLAVVTAAKLMTEAVTTAAPTTVAQVPKLSAPRRRKGVVIQDPKETAASVIMHTEVLLKDKGKGTEDEAFARQLEAELNANINWNDVIEQARKNMMIYLKNMAGFNIKIFKGMTYSEIRPLFEKHYNSIKAFLEKEEEEVTVQRKEIEEEGNKRHGESLEQDIAKKQRIDEEAEELKRHLQIVANDDDDVYTAPLASKVPVVDYQIHHENNKPYYKIIRADGTHKLFLSFITLLKNFDRENLETLWKLVKERFETTEPKNFLDDFLLNILRNMFEKPNVKANVWRDQKGKYGLAKKYPLTHFTVQQMLDNVRLKVKEESEISIELMRLVRRQLNEGYLPE
nr:hypothetical protein [Tanacetum cinerariifolium]